MTGFIVFIALLIIIVFFLGFSIGKTHLKHQWKKAKEKNDELRINALMNDDFAAWIILLVFFVYALVLLFPMLDGIRDYYIDKYRNDEIVEQISYKYRVIGGEKQISDSTFIYVNNK